MSSKIIAKEEKLSEPLCLITSLPNDIIVDILVRVSRFDYPTLSLVSKHFRSLVMSPEVYARRSLLGCTEHCLYVVLSDKKPDNCRWYILRRKANGNGSLVLIPSLPVLPYSRSFVSVGSRIYVFGGVEDQTSVFSIDCRSHTVQPLPSMPTPLIQTVAHTIDGKIYVFGYYGDSDDWEKVLVVVFNTETQMWEPGMIQPNIEISDMLLSGESHVMGGKIYIRNIERNNYIYEPKENTWETDEILNSKNWRNACVVDEVLYYYDCACYKEELRAYNPKQRCWRVVKGLEELLPETRGSWWSSAVNYGGNLALFFLRNSRIRSDIWCAEISLETRQGGDIWGQVEWCNNLVARKFWFEESQDVVV